MVGKAGVPDHYRLLFERLRTGAARCRLVVEGDRVVGVEVVESNPAFAAVRDVLPHLVEVFARMRGRSAENIQLRLDNRVLSISAYPLGDDEAMCVIEDVTIQDELRISQERFHQGFHGNAAAMVIARQDDLKLIDVNPRWCELHGVSRENAIGRTPQELGLISHDNAQMRISQHRERPTGYDVELALRHADGTPLTVLASAKPIEIAEGRCTLTTLIDITARKQAEDAFAVAFSASPAGMILVHAGTDVVVSVNKRLLEMTALVSEDFVGRPVNLLAFIRSPSRAELLAEIERNGRLDGVEVELNGKDGGVWTLASTETVTLHGQLHRLSVFTDISTRKRFEDGMRELNVELERRVEQRTTALQTSNRDLEAFTSSVSHDLRAPLRTMQGFSEILLEDYGEQLPDEAKELLSSIHASGERLRQLIDDLLSFSRLGREGLQLQRLELAPMVEAVIEELLANRDDRARIELHVDELGTAYADPSLLRAVWTNLVDNALKYSRTRETIKISIGRERRDAETVYFIQDNGVGFDSQYADRLFGVFQRLHAASEFEGNGVGLANVRRIVERHHGRVAASSVLDAGSKFEFTLGEEAGSYEATDRR